MKNKNLMSAFGILIVLLSVLGVAYAHWSDTVTIEGTVHMGELIVGILNNSVTWYETTNGVLETDFSPAKPWVANATITLSDFETSVHHTPPQTVAKKMTILMENAYPQWDLHIFFKLKNAGTIPATYKSASFTGKDETDNESLTLREDSWFYNSTLGAWIWEGALVDPNGTIMNIRLVAYVPEDGQLEPCNEYPIEIYFDFKQTAEECHTYTFKVEFEFIQWNKANG